MNFNYELTELGKKMLDNAMNTAIAEHADFFRTCPGGMDYFVKACGKTLEEFDNRGERMQQMEGLNNGLRSAIETVEKHLKSAMIQHNSVVLKSGVIVSNTQYEFLTKKA